MYSLIRPCAYEPNPNWGRWVVDFHVTTFADRWRSELLALHARGWRNPEPMAGLPIAKLNMLLRAAAPGVLSTGRGAGTDSAAPWIYARDRAPTEVVQPLFLSWVMELRPEPEHEDALQRVLESVNEATPQWTIEQIDLTGGGVSPGGTAEPDRRLYALLPELLAVRLAERSLRLPGLDKESRFRVVSRNQGTELVSWPPYEYRRGGRAHFYSAVITITLHTVPFTTRPRVHVSTGIRRWATDARVQLPNKRAVTVLVDAPIPWSTNADRLNRLIGNSMEYQPSLGRVVWQRHSSVEILPELDIVRTYPKPDDIISAPEDWIRGQAGIAAGVVHSTAMGEHAVGAGLMPEERARLDAWVEECLEPMFRRVPDLARSFRTNKPALRLTVPASDVAGRKTTERQAALARCQALLAALAGAPLRIDIVTQDIETRRALLGELARLLDFPESAVTDADLQSWSIGGLDVEIQLSELGLLGTALDVSRTRGRTRATTLGEAIRARRAMVASRFPRLAGAPGLAIVEILGEDRFKKVTDSDPKFALRLGLADTGRLSQFIEAGKASDADVDMRVKWTWLDGFRQLGAVPVPQRRIGDDVPENLQYVGLWVVRRRADGPTRRARRQLIALRIRPGDATHPVCGWDDANKEWIPYSRLLISLARDVELDADSPEKAGRDPRRALSPVEQREDIERRVRSILYQSRDRATLLLVNAGNMRDSWRWLGNGSLVKDMLGFTGEPTQRLAAYGSDLRIMLLRDRNSREEVPQWYASDGDNNIAGLALGLWAPTDADADNRVFASTADMPRNSPKLPRGLLKLGPHPNWRHAPTKTAWNPQYLELVVLGCVSAEALARAGRTDLQPDRPASWAALAHQLRFLDDYNPLVRPLPLHLAMLAEEYVLPVEPYPTVE